MEAPSVQKESSSASAAADSATAAAAIPLGKQPVPHAERAWEFFRSIGSPKFHVAPMVDQSELPFRMLCRKHGSTSAYTPMLHARLYSGDHTYRSEVFSTCEGDRPLFVQFCANDPDYLVKAAKLVESQCDAIDINFGCPQRIAKRGHYGAFLMEDLVLIEKLITSLVQAVSIPVTCKIRVFPELEKTLEYARMVERAGCCLLAVHGRTREQRDNTATRANWDYIKAVKQALSIPVLANGNIRNLQDAYECMEYTGCDGVLSAESLLADPALFSPRRLEPEGALTELEGITLAREYLEWCLQYPTHMRMVKGHVHKLIPGWLAEHTDLRDRINKGDLDVRGNLVVLSELERRVKEIGRSYSIPVISQRALERMEREAAKQAAIAEQEREAAALSSLNLFNDSCTSEAATANVWCDSCSVACEAHGNDGKSAACDPGSSSDPAPANAGNQQSVDQAPTPAGVSASQEPEEPLSKPRALCAVQ